ncbi:hypothetical protein AGR4C_Lc90186 [Agrobacterium tumefaciens str. Kerr 14]|uniref:Uncharacterized protein n=1 Tax=Agrobacterium tumefaciens str. Kerr 14 TaxID=1183424 RepID=A0A1S7S8G8_AGRTU|nr:hypothetical protein AGR4C_Lc90186 [Agrobacterium tumefaciens str. Kerr 14]
MIYFYKTRIFETFNLILWSRIWVETPSFREKKIAIDRI